METVKNKHSVLGHFVLHLHPKMINEKVIKFTRTFGLGGVNALLFFILAFTGLLLRFSYIPIPEKAYDSILALQNQSLFGTLLRNIHHWSAMLMVITAFLHLIRVFYSQSIYHKRRKNWYYGLLLFTVILAFNFTGYLLPWDQLSYWAVTIMTNIIEYIPFIGESFAHIIRGGEIVNENTLLNFYSFHTALLPILFIVFMVLHFWLIRKAKGVTIAQSDEKNMVPVNPELIYKEILVGLIILISIILFSISFDAPLLEKANPMISPNPSKAPWYFMGIQELLIHLHPVFVSLVIPLSLSLFFVMIAKINIDLNKVGTWFYSAKGKRIVFISIAFSFLLTLSLIFTFEYALHLNELSLPLFISTGLIPFSMYIIPVLVFILYLKKGNKADKIELTLSIMTIILSSYIVMSIVGIWLRGTGMHLIF